MSIFLKHFFQTDKPLFVCEFGHSERKESKAVGPWSRGFYLLHFVARGYVEFSGFRAEAGQAFLISKERMHSFTVSPHYEHFWIGFSGNAVASIFEGLGLEHTEHQLFCVEHPAYIQAIFASALEKLEDQSTQSPNAIALSALLSLLPMLKSEKQIQTMHRIDYAERAYLMIKNNYMYPLKMEDIAKEIHLSEKYMYRLFLKRFGLSPQQFLRKTRMEVAKELLKKQGMTVTEVAHAVGYSTLPIFSKAFTAYHGISPSALKSKANGRTETRAKNSDARPVS